MSKLIRVALAAALFLGVASGVTVAPVAADETETVVTASLTLEQLEAAVDAAQEVVDAIEAEIILLEEELDLAEAALEAAVEDRDAQAAIVQLKVEALADAELELEAAEATRNEVQRAYDECASGSSGNGCRNQLDRPGGALTVANADVVLMEAAVEAAADELEAERLVLDGLQEIVDDAQGDVTALEEAIAEKEEELAAAREILAAAQEALENYVPPVEDVHPGCKGLANASEQVTVKSKGKAPVVVAAVAEKLGC